MTATGLRILFPMLCVVLASMPLAGMQRATVTLVVEPGGASLLGQPVVLTATVNAAIGEGHVTVYDGTTILGTQPVSTRIGGQALLTTRFLEFGTRSLRVNADGRADLVATTLLGTVNVLHGAGNGTFGAPVSYPVAARSTAGFLDLAAGDLNADGHADIMVSAPDAGHVSVLRNTGQGSFHAFAPYTVPYRPTTLAMGDFNGNGRLDVAVGSMDTHTVGVLYGGGDGTLSAFVDYPLHARSRSLAVADCNGDGGSDLAVR